MESEAAKVEKSIDERFEELMQRLGGLGSSKPGSYVRRAKMDENEQLVKRQQIGLGDRVKIIPGGPEATDRRFSEMIGHEGIIIGFNSTTYDYYYHVQFESEEAIKTYKQGGGIYFNPTCVEKMGHDALAYQMYLRKKEEEKRIEKYRWGTCPTCEGPLDMYYVLWCPSCDKPEPLPAHNNAYSLIPMLEHMNVVEQDEQFKERVWDYLCDHYDFFQNDDYLTINLDDIGLKKEFDAIKRTWGLQGEVLTWVSW